jgi:competence CoiA-like predicted nuclease
MYVAIDKIGNRIYADDENRYIECFCPACGELLIHRKGSQKHAHFAHKQNTNCFMGLNKDYMSEWHIKMQSFFPKESREKRRLRLLIRQ